MKNQIAKAITMLGLVATLVISSLVGSVQAQGNNSFRISIPFDSMVGKKLLPAGEYRITMVPGAASRVAVIHSTDGRTSCVVGTTTPVEARETSSQSKLVFNRYGNQYFLSQLWEAGRSNGQQLRKSPAEREVAQSMSLAKNETKLEAVVLLARQ